MSECRHGQLQRQCELCEAEKQISDLTSAATLALDWLDYLLQFDWVSEEDEPRHRQVMQALAEAAGIRGYER